MLPDSVLSTQIVSAPFTYPRNIPKSPNVSYEFGGIALQDPSQGLRVQVWRGEYLNGQVVLSAPAVPAAPLLTIADVVDLDISFDQNMNPFVCYELEDGTARFYWFDSSLPGFTTTTLATGSFDLRCAHDDTRKLQVERGVSDVILAYLRAGSLYFRAQRERYQTEHLLSDEIGDRGLMRVGMNSQLRFQFQLSPILTDGSSG